MLKNCTTLLAAIWLLTTSLAHASDYYVRSDGGTGSGLDDANAWNLAKLNASKLSPGDRVLFKRGDVFFGTYIANSAGNPGRPILFDAYGTGANPVISGFSKLTSWTLLKGNIYYTTLDVPMLNVLTLDGAVKAMGRYPDTGYLPYTSHDGNQSVAGASIREISFDPTGGQVVLRKSRWILDRHPITSRVSGTLNYGTNNDYGNNGLYSPVDGNGFFIQHHLATLTTEGEWFYNKAARRLYMHFGSGTPEKREVKVGALDENVHINYWTNLTFKNLDFEGANMYGLYVIGTSNIVFDHCHVRYQGGDGIWGSYVTNLLITNSEVTHVLNNSIYVEQEGKDIAIDQVKINGSGLIAGAARSGDATQQGICVTGNEMTITNSSVVNTGYIGINFQGNNVLIERNLVDNFCVVKDDGGGIYTYNPGTTAENRIIRKNIVLNAQGAYAGAEGHYWEPFGKAAGIYLDDRSSNTEVDQNTVANGNWGGIFLHNTGDNQITNNLVYNFSQQLLFGVESASINRNFKITGNTFVARTSSQKTLRLDFAVADNPSLMGVFDRNVFARPVDDNQTFLVNSAYAGGGGEKSLSLGQWKSAYGMDSASSKSFVKVSKETDLLFAYNPSGEETEIPVASLCSEVNNARHVTKVRLLPYSGILLVKIPDNGLVQSIGSGNWIDPEVWSDGFVPGPSDDVRINKGHTIQVDQDIFTRKIDVSSGAELHFSGNHKVEKVE